MKTTFHNPSIADLKKLLFFFRSFLRKNISTKWRSRHRPIVDYFSWKKPPTFCRMNMIFFSGKQKKYRPGIKRQIEILIFLFVLNTQKKTFHTKTHFGSKNTASTRSGWCKHFLSQNGFLCEIFFFCMFKTKRKMEISIWRFVPHLYLFFFYRKKLHSWGRRSGAYFMKNSQQMDNVPIFISSIYFFWGMIKTKCFFLDPQ